MGLVLNFPAIYYFPKTPGYLYRVVLSATTFIHFFITII